MGKSDGGSSGFTDISCGAVLYTIGIATEEIVSLLTDLMPSPEPFDSKQAYLAVELRNVTKEKGLSLGDRSCLALSKIKQLPPSPPIRFGVI